MQQTEQKDELTDDEAIRREIRAELDAEEEAVKKTHEEIRARKVAG